jgi:hypothetical protein
MKKVDSMPQHEAKNCSRVFCALLGRIWKPLWYRKPWLERPFDPHKGLMGLSLGIRRTSLHSFSSTF